VPAPHGRKPMRTMVWSDHGPIVILSVTAMKKDPRKTRNPRVKTDRGARAPAAARDHRHREDHRQEDRRPEDRRRPRFSRELVVIYEDDALVVVDKPAGLLAVPVEGSDAPSALSLLIAGLQQNHKRTRQRVLIVHRIDRFSSGALLFAKTDADRHLLLRQFLAHTPVRRYLAVVRGRVAEKAGTLVHYFRRQGMFQQLRSAKDPQATRAELRYSVQRVFADATLVQVELETGLQNQIRAQFSAMGHPVIGDRKYHPEESQESLIARVALHAAHLEFVHPRTKETVAMDSKLPADFERLLAGLGKGRGR
jgi:23S rRNA pseudouridine1911/1915/1917 synthase